MRLATVVKNNPKNTAPQNYKQKNRKKKKGQKFVLTQS